MLRSAPLRRDALLIRESSADDILLTTAFTGLQTNMLRPSISAAGLDPDHLPARGAIDISEDIDIGAREARPSRWRDIWSAGHSTSGGDGSAFSRRTRGADDRGISRRQNAPARFPLTRH
jgi:nitronate monooxygenase